MITKEQEEWINHLSDSTISIVPYDPRTPELFAAVEKRIKRVIGNDVVIRHCGASSLGISGQNEIDVAIVVKASRFEGLIPRLEKEFGQVRSRYPDRARFEVRQDGKKIDLKIVDEDHPNYIASVVLEDYLKANPVELQRYEALKGRGNGKSMKEYYRSKTEFVNEILEKAKR